VTPTAEVLSFADADIPGENLSDGMCDGLVSLVALGCEGEVCSRSCGISFLLELIYVMLELFTARFFSK
jgi:hypothetical protein